MKTLDEHNKEMQDHLNPFGKRDYKAGVLCPNCKSEMILVDPLNVNLSYPASQSVKCLCGYTGYKTL